MMRLLLLLPVASVSLGCAGNALPAPDTSARARAQQFFDSLVRKDWTGAYASLHADSRRNVNLEEFTQRAMAYRRRLPFEPQKALVRSCQEQDTRAIARVVLEGNNAGKNQTYRDGLELRQDQGGWSVVLPGRFGR